MNDLLLWLVTYGVHSSAIFLVVLVLDKTRLVVRDEAKDWMWRAALVCGIASASLQVGFGWVPWTGQATLPFELASAPEAGGQPGSSPAAFPLKELETRAAPRPAFAATHVYEPAVAGANRPLPKPAAGIQAPRQDLMPLVFMGLAGFLLAAGLIGRLRLRRILGRRRPLTDAEWTGDLDELCEAGRPLLRPRLTVSRWIESPVALGTLQPEICLPERALPELTPELRRAVLAHELAHHVRFDPFWLELASGLKTLLFFQPANRHAHKRLLELSEFGADSLATNWTGDGLALARSLTEVAGWLSPAGPRPGPCSMVAKGGDLERRVHALVTRARNHVELGAGPMVRIAVLTAALLMPFALPGWSGANPAIPSAQVDRPFASWSLAEQRIEILRARIGQLENESHGLDFTQGAALRVQLGPLIQELDALEQTVERQLAHAVSPFTSEPPAPFTNTSDSNTASR